MKSLVVAVITLIPSLAASQWIQLDDSLNCTFVTRDTLLRISNNALQLELSTDAGITWATQSDLPTMREWMANDTLPAREVIREFTVKYPSTVYLGTMGLKGPGWGMDYGRLYRSTNLGKSWKRFPDEGLAAEIVDTSFSSLEIPTPGGLVIRTTDHILTSQDRGNSWRIVSWKDTKCKPTSSWVPQSSPLIFFSPDTCYYYGIAVGFEQNKGYYDIPFSYFTIDGWQSCDAPGWTATDWLGGDNWLKRTHKYLDNDRELHEIYHQTDLHSSSWKLAFTDTVEKFYNTPRFVKYNGVWLMAWKDRLIYRSEDSGRSWSPWEGFLLPEENAYLFLSEDGQDLFAGGREHLYRLERPSVVNDGRLTADVIQIWPNPASSEIKLILPAPNPIYYTISDCLGREALSGFAGPAGTVDITSLSPGTYYLSSSGGIAKFVKQ